MTKSHENARKPVVMTPPFRREIFLLRSRAFLKGALRSTACRQAVPRRALLSRPARSPLAPPDSAGRAHRPRDVLQRLFAEIEKLFLVLSRPVDTHPPNANPAALADSLERARYSAVPIDRRRSPRRYHRDECRCGFDAAFGDAGVAFDHAALHFDGAATASMTLRNSRSSVACAFTSVHDARVVDRSCPPERAKPRRVGVFVAPTSRVPTRPRPNAAIFRFSSSPYTQAVIAYPGPCRPPPRGTSIRLAILRSLPPQFLAAIDDVVRAVHGGVVSEMTRIGDVARRAEPPSWIIAPMLAMNSRCAAPSALRRMFPARPVTVMPGPRIRRRRPY